MSFIAGLLGSKTVWGIIVALLGTLASKLGWGIGSAEINQVIDLVVQLVGLVLALYGRIVAKGPIA